MSLRSRLTLLLVTGIGLPLAVGGLAIELLVPRWLHAEFDRALASRAGALVSMTVIQDGEVDLEFSDQFIPEFEDDEDPYYFEVWLASGELVERSRSFFPSRDVQLPGLEREASLSDEPRTGSVVLPDGRRGRQHRIDFVVEPEDPEEDEDDPEEEPFEEDDPLQSPVDAAADGSGVVATVLVAGSTEEVDARIAGIRIATIAVTVLLILALTVIVRLALHLGLRPIGGVVGQVAAMDADSLGERIDADQAPSELQPLLEQLNALIERLGRAFRRERQLTADIAHELKTPIAELRSLGEVGERWPDDREAVVRFFADAQEVARHMERVVVNLLALARHDAGQQVVRSSEVDVGALVRTAWKPLAEQAAQRGLTFRIDAPEGAVAVSDPDKLELMLSNLLSNAAAHAPEGSEVTCSVALEGDDVRVSIANPAVGLEPRDLDVMFDRFWRKDQARSGGASAGLGLSLVRAFANLLGVRVDLALADDDTFSVCLRIPARAGDRVAGVAPA